MKTITVNPKSVTRKWKLVDAADKPMGNKNLQKEYFHHTGHIAGERWINFADLMAKDPTAPLTAAIWGMLPHSALGHKMVKKLKIYAGAEHPHAAQNPEVVDF